MHFYLLCGFNICNFLFFRPVKSSEISTALPKINKHHPNIFEYLWQSPSKSNDFKRFLKITQILLAFEYCTRAFVFIPNCTRNHLYDYLYIHLYMQKSCLYLLESKQQSTESTTHQNDLKLPP